MAKGIKKISPKVIALLSQLSKSGATNLYSDKTIKLLSPCISKVESSHKVDTKRSTAVNRLIDQLPDGIYPSMGEVALLIKNSTKVINTKSVSYSPMVIPHKEFQPCKVMKHMQGNIITGRDVEIQTVLLTLCKKSKRGTILIGDPGVGKTAIVQAINSKLIERTVPRQLIGCHILNMDVPYILSKYKEDPVGVIIGILEKASEYDKAILFIDEVHQLLGHRMNDILKPYLTEKIRFIGSTTINEYHSIITEDSALERRFTIVHVNEPNVEQTTEMVKGTKSVFEEQHKCMIPNDICDYLVKTGSRFLGHRRNPDKSLDILDVACSIMYEKEIHSIFNSFHPTGDFLKDIELKRKQLESMTDVAGNRVLVEEYINLAISSVTGVSYTDIENSTNYDEVVSGMKGMVFGQDKAMESIANVVNIFKHAKCDRERPISILLTVGPSGCGKKTSAQLLAKYLFGNKNYFIDYDMSSFKDAFALTELKGAPPGYVGYAKSGGLIKAVRTNPLSVLYFRGINNSHEAIRKYIIDCCRSGRMVDSAEREAKLNNTIVIYSVTLSDKEYEELQKGKARKGMGFTKNENQQTESEVSKTSLSSIIGDDLVNSCDEIILFNKLEKADLERIYNSNLDYYLDMYGVDIDKDTLQKEVLSTAKNGHDIIARLSSEVPKQVFKILSVKEKKNEKINISKESN
jgi:ATP-dependent Clp protease ATP-binding subunit ClpC